MLCGPTITAAALPVCVSFVAVLLLLYVTLATIAYVYWLCACFVLKQQQQRRRRQPRRRRRRRSGVNRKSTNSVQILFERSFHLIVVVVVVVFVVSFFFLLFRLYCCYFLILLSLQIHALLNSYALTLEYDAPTLNIYFSLPRRSSTANPIAISMFLLLCTSIDLEC